MNFGPTYTQSMVNLGTSVSLVSNMTSLPLRPYKKTTLNCVLDPLPCIQFLTFIFQTHGKKCIDTISLYKMNFQCNLVQTGSVCVWYLGLIIPKNMLKGSVR